MKQLYHFPILGKVIINIPDLSLSNFTKRQLKNYFIRENNANSNSTFIEYVNCKNAKRLEEFIDKYSHLGRWISVSDSALHIDQYSYSINDDTVRIEKNMKTPLFHKTMKKIYYISLGNTAQKRHASLHSMYYESILFPLLSLLALSGGYYLLHGSLLEIKNKYIILCGLDGVGKSSACNIIERNGKGKLLSDNIVLFNGKYAVPFNCAMRLPKSAVTSYEILYTTDEFMEVLPPSVLYDKCIVDKIFTLSVSKNNFHMNTIKCNLTNLALYLNNASEINKGNRLATVLSYINTLVDNTLETNMIDEFYDVSIPFGEIEKATEVLINEC